MTTALTDVATDPATIAASLFQQAEDAWNAAD